MDAEAALLMEMAEYYFRDRRARIAPNAWAHLPVCCGFRVAAGDRCPVCNQSPEAPPDDRRT